MVESSGRPIEENFRMVSGRIKAEIRKASGATASRIISGPLEDRVHHHEWPVLSIHVIGEMTKFSDEGEVAISSAAAIFHEVRASHANVVGARGCEQIDIVFDPAWLGMGPELQLNGVPSWIGGPTAFAARRLARLWLAENTAEDELKLATKTFLRLAASAKPRTTPPWLSDVLDKLQHHPRLTAAELAPIAGCQPQWLTQAFRAAMGEGLAEVSMRIRVEKAALLLRTTQKPAAQVALEAGFCDQSHMNRCFKSVLSRTPLEVRAEASQCES